MKNRSNTAFREIALSAASLFAVVLALSAFVWLSATQQAAAFNRITAGPKVTTWDAVWLDLRVEAQ